MFGYAVKQMDQFKWMYMNNFMNNNFINNNFMNLGMVQ